MMAWERSLAAQTLLDALNGAFQGGERLNVLEASHTGYLRSDTNMVYVVFDDQRSHVAHLQVRMSLRLKANVHS